MEFDDFVTTQVRIYPDCEKHCRLVEAEYTAEAKRVWLLDKYERSRVLGGLECVRDDDFAVKIKFKEPCVTFNSGMTYSFSNAQWAIVKRDEIDSPVRIFKEYEDANNLIIVKIAGEARLAIDMLRVKSKGDSRINLFVKDWKNVHSYPAYSTEKTGVAAITKRWKPSASIQNYQIRLWVPDNGRAIYGLVAPWTKHKKLVIPLSRYSHPATADEMWTNRYLYQKDDSLFRAVYLFWNTRVVDERTIWKSWIASVIPVSEQELVRKMICWIFLEYYPNSCASLTGMPINATSRVGAPIQKWDEDAITNPRLMEIMRIHTEEAKADMNLIASGTDAVDMYKDPILSAKKRVIELYGDDTPSLFPKEN